MSLQDLYDLAPPDDEEDKNKQPATTPPPPVTPPPPSTYDLAMAAPDLVLPGQYASLTPMVPQPQDQQGLDYTKTPEFQQAQQQQRIALTPQVSPPIISGLTQPTAFIFHHTSGGGDVAGVEDTLRQRHLGVEFVMDRNGNIVRTGNAGASHMLPGWGAGAGLSNANTIGMEVIAANNRDVTPAQVAAAQNFIAQYYPNTPVYGHGEVNPGHKEADEGAAIVSAIRRQRGSDGAAPSGVGYMQQIPSGIGLGQMRQSAFALELGNPDMRRLFAASVAAEVGGQGPRAEQAYIEAVMNRALSRGKSLTQTINDPSYYPQTTMSKLGYGFGPDEQARINGMISNAMKGSNISNFATGNESGNVHSGGAPVAFNPGTGERFVQENADRAWVQRMLGGGAGAAGSLDLASGGMPARSSSPVSSLLSRGQAQYATAEPLVMSDVSPEDTPDEESQQPYQEAKVNILDAVSPEEMQRMQDYLNSLKPPAATPAPITPPATPVDLQAPVLPANSDATRPSAETIAAMYGAGNGSAMTPSGLTHIVTGADDNPQVVHEIEAMANPTVGMTRGVGLSPDVMAKIASGQVPNIGDLTAEQARADGYTAIGSQADVDAMTHQAEAPNPVPGMLKTAAENALEFYHHGLTGVFPELKKSLPGWLNKAGEVIQSPAAEDVLSTANIGGLPLIESAVESGLKGARTLSRDPVTGRFISTKRVEPTVPALPEAPPKASATPSNPVAELLALREQMQAPPSELRIPPAPQLEMPKAPTAKSASELGVPPAELRIPEAIQPPAERPQRTGAVVKPVTPTATPPAVAPTATAPAAMPIEIIPASQVPNLPPAAASPASLTQTPATARAPVPKATPAVAPPAQPPMPPAVAPPAAPPAAVPPQQTYTPFRAADYARMADDQTAPITTWAGRMGLSHNELENLRETLQTKSGAQSQGLANAAVLNGRADAADFSYRTPSGVSLPEIQAYAQRNQGFKDYLNVLDTLDDIRSLSPHGQRPLPLQPGPVSVRGFTEADALQYIRNAEAAHPDWVRVRDLFNEHRLETRRIMANGEYATMTQAELAAKNSSNPNEIPWKGRDWNAGPNDSAGRPIVRPDPILQAMSRTTKAIRSRLNNEAVGKTVDTIRNAPGGKHSFTQISNEARLKSPALRARTVSFKRRGQWEHYVADSRTVADLLKMDPYAFSYLNWAGSAPRRLFVTATTGLGSPHFAVTDALRNWHIAQGAVADFNTRPGSRLPRFTNRRAPPSLLGVRTALGSVIGRGGGASGRNPLAGTLMYAQMSQLLPVLSKFAAHSINSTSGGWLRRTFGNAATDHLADVLASIYARSTMAQVEARGVHNRGFMTMNEDRAMANNKWTSALTKMRNTPGLSQTADIWDAYKRLLNATHNSTQFAYIQRNLKGARREARAKLGPNASQADVNNRAMDILTEEANKLVGDPLVTGRLFTPGTRGERSRMITYDPGMHATTGQMARGYAGAIPATAWNVANEVGRQVVPWHNMTVQGAKRIVASALDNPAEFAMRAAAYYMLPAGIGYFWNASAGKDPNGVPYIYHQTSLLSEYEQSMYQYVAIPGLPASWGIMFPTFQENTFFKRAMEASLHHLFGMKLAGVGPEWSYTQDLQAAMASFLDVAVAPPMSPWMSIQAELSGFSSPQNYFAYLPDSVFGALGQNTGNVDIGGDIYKRKNQPYDTNRNLAQTFESTLRAVMPAPVDMALAGYNAYTHSPDDASTATKLKNAFSQVGKLETQRTPLLNTAMGLNKPLSGNTRQVAEMFNRQKSIDQLDTYYHTYGLEGETQIGKAKPRSKSGAAIATAETGEPLPPSPPGLPQRPATNPMYRDFMETFYNLTKHDSTRTGGAGLLSIMDRYRDATKAINMLRNIDAGNLITWQQRIQQSPDIVAFAKANHVNINNPTSVRNLYERYRQNVARVLNRDITKVEDIMNLKYPQYAKQLGRRIKIEDLNPHEAPNWAAIQGAEPAPEEAPQP